MHADKQKILNQPEQMLLMKEQLHETDARQSSRNEETKSGSAASLRLAASRFIRSALMPIDVMCELPASPLQLVFYNANLMFFNQLPAKQESGSIIRRPVNRDKTFTYFHVLNVQSTVKINSNMII